MCNEMEEMNLLREQFDVLRRKLASQQIVNERMVRRIVTGKMSWNKSVVNLEIWLLIPMVVLLYGAFWAAGMLSGRATLFIMTVCAADAWLDYLVNCRSDRQWLEGDLVSARLELLKMNRLRHRKLSLDIIAIILLMVVLVAEFASHGLPLPLLVAMGIGGLIGLIVAIFIYRKMQRNNEEAIRAIDEIMKEDGNAEE